MEYTKYTVAVALIFGNRIWMSKRKNTKNFPDKWQFAGGKLEDGENPVTGALRELREETGLTIHSARLDYLGPNLGDPSTRACYIYKVELSENEVPVKTENTMTEWFLFTYKIAMELDLIPGVKGILKELKMLYENEPEKLPRKP